MVTVSVNVGSAVNGAIECTPLPGMLKAIVSAPAFELAFRIACRNEPLPLSFVFVTTKVAAGASAAEVKAKTRATKHLAGKAFQRRVIDVAVNRGVVKRAAI